MLRRGDATSGLGCASNPGACGFGGAQLTKEGIQHFLALAAAAAWLAVDGVIRQILPPVDTDDANLADSEHGCCGSSWSCSLARSRSRTTLPHVGGGWLQKLE